MEEIKVIVVKYGDRDNLLLRYTDPMSGRRKTKSAGTNKKREAERAAAKWEAELREGRYHAPSKITWEDFREKYESEVLTGLAPATMLKNQGIFNRVEEILNPRFLRELTSERISYFLSEMRKRGRSEETVKGCAVCVVGALRRAASWGMVAKVPKVVMPKRTTSGSKAKGRPITTEEFERMLSLLPKLLTTKRRTKGWKLADYPPPAELVAQWDFFLRGLWLSGLRLAESLELYWDRDDKLQVDLSSKYGVLRIPAALEKGNQDRELPIAPEFVELLESVPEGQRTGMVFKLGKTAGAGQMTTHQVGVRICDLGKLAGVVVKRTPGSDPDKPTIKYASAHDLRRSFGDRWAKEVMPQVLMELMRHENIDTTMGYYVSKNAQTTAAILWNARGEKGNTKGNNAEKRHSEPQK